LAHSKESRDSAEIKSEIVKLYEIYNKMQKLASMKLKSYDPTPLILGNVSEGDIERRVKEFSEALTNFLKLRIKTNATLAAFGNSIKSLANASDTKEISALIGLTALSDRNEYNRMAAMLRRYYSEQLEHAIPEMVKVFKWVQDLNDFSLWLDKLLNRNLAVKEDEFTEMIIAIRDQDIGRFRDLSKMLESRINLEERKWLH
jgi:hypothetical protein